MQFQVDAPEFAAFASIDSQRLRAAA